MAYLALQCSRCEQSGFDWYRGVLEKGMSRLPGFRLFISRQRNTLVSVIGLADF